MWLYQKRLYSLWKYKINGFNNMNKTYNLKYMENLNRSRIMNSENERIMIENAIKRYRESISENKVTIDDTG